MFCLSICCCIILFQHLQYMMEVICQKDLMIGIFTSFCRWKTQYTSNWTFLPLVQLTSVLIKVMCRPLVVQYPCQFHHTLDVPLCQIWYEICDGFRCFYNIYKLLPLGQTIWSQLLHGELVYSLKQLPSYTPPIIRHESSFFVLIICICVQLREYVNETEDYINIMLDDMHNHLLMNSWSWLEPLE